MTWRRSSARGLGFILVGVCGLIGVFADIAVGEGPSKAVGNSGWSAGVASVDITPAGPVWMAGYAARKSPSEGITLPLHAKALALRDGDGHTALIVTADLIGFDRALSAAVTDRIKGKHGLPREAVVFFASHTHTGPALKNVARNLRESGLDADRAKPNEEYRRVLEDKLVAVASEALAKLEPATLSYGVGKAGFAMNRREKTPTGFKIGVNPSGPTDKTVPVLRVADAQGKLRAVVFGYACHNTTHTDKIMTLSGDFAGFARERIEADNPGAVALFVTGCAGDANPEPRGTVELGRRHGRELAEAVEAVLGRAGDLKTLSGPLRFAYDEPTLHFAGPTDRASYEKRLKEPGSGRQAHAKRLIARIDAGEPVETTYPYPVHALALGDSLTLLALAGEVVVDYALRLKPELSGPGRDGWVGGDANDVFGYVPSVRVLNEGGYEGGEAFHYSTFPTPFAPDVEETIVKAAREVVGRVR
jgi:neutral ceramidase